MRANFLVSMAVSLGYNIPDDIFNLMVRENPDSRKGRGDSARNPQSSRGSLQMAFQGWEKVDITTDQGAGETAIAPLIISASRATDIPAFYPDWFIRRLETGYCKWVNPFSGKPQYVSLTKARFVVFWSKNPAPMIPRLPVLDERRIGWYFQFTLNDYEQEGFEPNVPPLKERVETFQRLARKAGRERVVWRFDPLIRTAGLGPEELLEKIRRIGERIHPFTEKLVISFADIGGYAKVKRNLNVAGVPWKDFTKEDIGKNRPRRGRSRKGLGPESGHLCRIHGFQPVWDHSQPVYRS